MQELVKRWDGYIASCPICGANLLIISHKTVLHRKQAIRICPRCPEGCHWEITTAVVDGKVYGKFHDMQRVGNSCQ